MKRLCGTVLAMEAVLLALCIVPSMALSHVHGAVAGGLGGGLAVVAVALSGMVGRRRWALYAGSALQLAVIAAGVVLPVMYGLGVIFAALWFGGIKLARKWEGPQAGASGAGTANPAS